ncbi:hypothetical protein T4B_6802 [Trichinella pseudospiralis]|uniref:Uncharacterized protein n=2 Tax=Trichinella pseudospiralis TaxID=6337 RepID=A0A0V0XN70_TRIPS|nr:hypothetical protein T4E_7806 [Trichinella pseudospiralis]KRY66299.1 hypothetical protein T4A_9518 [Trichinella pseudospiralis]KRY82839.1 hypothetical protein T4D_7310 [Trichinella pseudospiralis]KRZ22118.1 hypothetical protein T4B_6802 [Trichinella pseudospiralis]
MTTSSQRRQLHMYTRRPLGPRPDSQNELDQEQRRQRDVENKQHVALCVEGTKFCVQVVVVDEIAEEKVEQYKNEHSQLIYGMSPASGFLQIAIYTSDDGQMFRLRIMSRIDANCYPAICYLDVTANLHRASFVD